MKKLLMNQPVTTGMILAGLVIIIILQLSEVFR